MHGTVEEMCREAGFLPRVRHEVAEPSTLVTLVAAGRARVLHRRARA